MLSFLFEFVFDLVYVDRMCVCLCACVRVYVVACVCIDLCMLVCRLFCFSLCVFVCVCVRTELFQLLDSEYSLPELSDGGGEVGDVGSKHQGLVLAECVLHTPGCVPWLIAFGPWQLRLKALE